MFILYMILGYLATGRTIYRNSILMGTASGIFLHRLIIGTVAGFILIPIAIVLWIGDAISAANEG